MVFSTDAVSRLPEVIDGDGQPSQLPSLIHVPGHFYFTKNDNGLCSNVSQPIAFRIAH